MMQCLKQNYSGFCLHGTNGNECIDCTVKTEWNKAKFDKRLGLARPIVSRVRVEGKELVKITTEKV